MIDIQDIIPFMKDGWVAMDGDGDWWWFPLEPYLSMTYYEWSFMGGDGYKEAIHISAMFDIAPADDWTKSLIKVGGK